MHQTLTEINAELKALAASVSSTMPNDEPVSVAHGNWSFTGITRNELAEVATSLIELINTRGQDSLGTNEVRLADYPRRLVFLRTNTVPQLWTGNAVHAIPAYLLTLDALRRALETALTTDLQTEAVQTLRKVSQQLRGMESRVRALEPRATTLTSMIERIESAHDAADRLPTDLESLAEAQRQLEKLLKEATKDSFRVSTVREDADKLDTKLKAYANEATAVLAKCESAYSAATSKGLAAAFSERSDALNKSMLGWAVALVIALVAGACLGITRLHDLGELMKSPAVSERMLALNLLLALLSVGGPVWFGWIATKQLGQRFRLSEDYAFKASISRAYEGYRREAARIDKDMNTDMEVRLLASALTRLDELPLRLVETATHGSPIHELINSDLVKQAAKTVPDFIGNVTDMAKNALNGIGQRKAKSPDETPPIQNPSS